MPCLTEETVQSFVEGKLSGEAEASLHAHCGVCTDCRRLLAEVARAVFDDTGDASSRAGDKQRIGRYVIVEPIGEGGSSIVYAASDPELGRKVALKLLRSGSSATGEVARQRMLREGRAMALLSHPNVVTVYDVGTWEGQVFVAMELVVGQTLKQWQRTRKSTRRQLLEVYLAAGRGLAAAHAAGLVHRDFKPENVLVGDDGRVRVTDFGLARPASSSVETAVDGAERTVDSAGLRARLALATLTQTGALVGTPAYMAPEQFACAPTDARTDQFSFCVALFEALYGARPFASDTLEELVLKVLHGGAVVPPRHADDPLAPALLRGLDVKPDQRHPSMEALLELVEGELAPPAGVALARPTRRVGVAMAVAALGLTAGVAVTTLRNGAASDALTGDAPLGTPSIAPDVPRASEPVAKEVANEPVAEPSATAEPQAAALAPTTPSRSVPRQKPTKAASAAAPSRPPAAATTTRRAPGSGAREDDALITDPWSGP